MNDRAPYPLNTLYAVTEDGRVFRVAKPRSGRTCPYELRPHAGKRGYLTVAIDGRTTPIHLLVARTFIPNPLGLPEVAHGNGNRHDNRKSNLRWASRKENNDDRVDHDTILHSDRHPTRVLSAAEVQSIRAEYASAGTYHRILAERHGVTRECVTRAINRKNWRHVD